MALVEIKPPAGFYNHGTDLESEGRWRDGNLVRWHEGSLRPIRGWAARNASAEYNAAPRGMLAWQDNGASRWIAAGTYNKLYVTTSGGTTSDITPDSGTSAWLAVPGIAHDRLRGGELRAATVPAWRLGTGVGPAGVVPRLTR